MMIDSFKYVSYKKKIYENWIMKNHILICFFISCRLVDERNEGVRLGRGRHEWHKQTYKYTLKMYYIYNFLRQHQHNKQ
jgi:hypothetical protein